MKRTNLFSSLSCLCLAATGACGDDNTAAGKDFSQSYLTLNGFVSGSPGDTAPEDLRVALVWEVVVEDFGESQLFIAQDVAIESVFPASFEMSVDVLPPQEAMTEYNLASGRIVVYQDSNGNGQLDGTPADASIFVDRLMGYPSGLQIIYSEGATAEAPNFITPGVYLERTTFDPDIPTFIVESLPLDHTIEIQLRTEEKYSCYLMTPPPVIPISLGDLGPWGGYTAFACPDSEPVPGVVPSCVRGEYENVAIYDVWTEASSPAIADMCGDLGESCVIEFETSNPPDGCDCITGDEQEGVPFYCD